MAWFILVTIGAIKIEDEIDLRTYKDQKHCMYFVMSIAFWVYMIGGE